MTHTACYRLALLAPLVVPALPWAFPVLDAGEATAFVHYSVLAPGRRAIRPPAAGTSRVRMS